MKKIENQIAYLIIVTLIESFMRYKSSNTKTKFLTKNNQRKEHSLVKVHAQCYLCQKKEKVSSLKQQLYLRGNSRMKHNRGSCKG